MVRIVGAVFGVLIAVFMASSQASAISINSGACSAISSSGGESAICMNQNENVTSQDGFVANLTRIILFLVGTAAVIMIVIGGIKYATANGDATKIKSAKDTIMYSVVGLIVALMAYAIVGFVVSSVAQGQ